MNNQIDNEDRAEAERLALLPEDVLKEALALIGEPANNPKVPKKDREEARRRVDAIKRHLRRMKRGRNDMLES